MRVRQLFDPDTCTPRYLLADLERHRYVADGECVHFGRLSRSVVAGARVC